MQQPKLNKQTKQQQMVQDQPVNYIYISVPDEAVIKRSFYLRLPFIAAGAALIYAFADTNGPLRFVTLAGIILISVQVLLIAWSFQNIVNAFFPFTRKQRATPNKTDKIIRYCISGSFFAGILFGAFQIRYTVNTIGGMHLFKYGILYGFCTALVLSIVLYHTRRPVYQGEKGSARHLALFLGVILVVTWGRSFVNRCFADAHVNCTSYTIVKTKSERHTSHGRSYYTYSVYIKTAYNDAEEFDVKKEFYRSVNSGDVIQLCTKKGLLGYDVVTGFKK